MRRKADNGPRPARARGVAKYGIEGRVLPVSKWSGAEVVKMRQGEVLGFALAFGGLGGCRRCIRWRSVCRKACIGAQDGESGQSRLS